MGDPVATAVHILQGIVAFFHTLVPGGFGLILMPLIALGFVSILVSRKG
jgi:hypothetical protein